MNSNFQFEFNNYINQKCLLKKIFDETLISVNEIAISHYFNKDQLSDICLKEEDEKFIREIIETPVGIVILGSKSWAKAIIVNELLGCTLLPVDNSDRMSPWRTIRFLYGSQTIVSLAVAHCYELVEHLAVYDEVWHTIPKRDLELNRRDGSPNKDPGYHLATLEVKLPHPLLKDDVQIVVSPGLNDFETIYQCCFENINPIVIYAIAGEDECLTPLDVQHLCELKVREPKIPVFFIRTKEAPTPTLSPSPSFSEFSTSELTESQQHWYFKQQSQPLPSPNSSPLCSSVPPSSSLPNTQFLSFHRNSSSMALYQQLSNLGFLNQMRTQMRGQLTNESVAKKSRRDYFFEVTSELVESFSNFSSILLFFRNILRSNLVSAATLLNETHNQCLRMFILSAFDMTWDLQITPKRIEYAKQREAELFSSLMGIANRKQEEIKQLITEAIDFMREDILNQAANHEFTNPILNYSNVSARELRNCTEEIQDLVLTLLNSAIAAKLVGSVDYMRDSFIGTLERCLSCLEKSCQEAGEPLETSSALKQILNAAYQIEVNVKTSYNLLRVLWEKMKQLVSTISWKPYPNVDSEWKKKVASDILISLSESRLAKSICVQFRERLKLSHDYFAASLKQLEALHTGRMRKTDDKREQVRKNHAPVFARFALESTSLIDVIIHGMPSMGREIGRGQYGVVYSCDRWAGYFPCAIKSVVPPDDKHWNDLAMEFYYTRSIPEHERVVQIRGSVIDYTYGGGITPAVLLIMDRMTRDLYAAIKNGLEWMSRLQVAIDVIHGIRFLHGQGLVHRDIKLKNVLLDKKNRAKITDLGFCKPEAMMSGSIVGTPIHMAPELFSGHYDGMVDVYAFGVLFWYICAGHVRLPYVFEQCQSKDQLWTVVKKGVRPERLPQFDEECWQLMEQCWNGDSTIRPLLGNVESKLIEIKERYRTSQPPKGYTRNYMRHRMSNKTNSLVNK